MKTSYEPSVTDEQDVAFTHLESEVHVQVSHSSIVSANDLIVAPPMPIYDNHSGSSTPSTVISSSTIAATISSASTTLEQRLPSKNQTRQHMASDKTASTDAMSGKNASTVAGVGNAAHSLSKEASDSDSSTSCSSKDSRVMAQLKALLRDSKDEAFAASFKHFRKADISPPITQQSLTELDIKRIVTNPQFRQDVNFDIDLDVRRNERGHNAEIRKSHHDAYWCAIAIEIELCTILSKADSRSLQDTLTGEVNLEALITASQKRLPNMFSGIMEIITTLVPSLDASQVRECLDVHLVMQQINQQAFDLVEKATWLGELLKKHCAPMRDKMVSTMMADICKDDSFSVARGLRQAFAILEAMKLDLLNYQIRSLRPHMVEDTTTFHIKFHAKRLKNGYMSDAKDADWFRTQLDMFLQCESDEDSDDVYESVPDAFIVFVHAFIGLILPAKPWPSVPDSFALDTNRVNYFRSVVLEDAFVNLSYQVFEECCDEVAQEELQLSLEGENAMRSQLRIIMGERRISAAIPYLAAHIGAEVQVLTSCTEVAQRRVTEEAELLLEQRFSFNSAEFEIQHLVAKLDLYQQITSISKKCMHVSAWDLHTLLVRNPKTPKPAEVVLPAPRSTAPSSESISFADPNRYPERAKQMAHLAILHYRTWGPLIYDRVYMEETTSPPASPSQSEV